MQTLNSWTKNVKHLLFIKLSDALFPLLYIKIDFINFLVKAIDYNGNLFFVSESKIQ